MLVQASIYPGSYLSLSLLWQNKKPPIGRGSWNQQARIARRRGLHIFSHQRRRWLGSMIDDQAQEVIDYLTNCHTFFFICLSSAFKSKVIVTHPRCVRLTSRNYCWRLELFNTRSGHSRANAVYIRVIWMWLDNLKITAPSGVLYLALSPCSKSMFDSLAGQMRLGYIRLAR